MRRLKVMVDYGAWPVWDMDSGANINPHTLPLSLQTLDRLLAWSASYEVGFDWSDPSASPPWPPERLVQFETEGKSVWKTLIQELQGLWNVYYFSEETQHILDPTASTA